MKKLILEMQCFSGLPLQKKQVLGTKKIHILTQCVQSRALISKQVHTITPLPWPYQMTYTSFPLDFQFSQVIYLLWDASRHDVNRSLKCVCMMRPVCLYLGQDHEKSMLWTTSWSEERDMCSRPGTHPQPGSKPGQTYLSSQPIANLYKPEKINVVLSHWVGVGPMQHH